MKSNTITRGTFLSVASIFAGSFEHGGAILVITGRSPRVLKSVDRFGGNDVSIPGNPVIEKNGEKVTFTGDLDAQLNRPVEYIGYILGEAAEKACINLDQINRVELMSQIKARFEEMIVDNDGQPITIRMVLDTLHAVYASTGRVREGKTWSKTGTAWADAVVTTILNWAKGDLTVDSNPIVGIISMYGYDVVALTNNGKRNYTKRDIAMATPGIAYAVAVMQDGTLEIIGTLPLVAMTKNVADRWSPFMVIKKGMKLVAPFTNLLRQGSIDGNTILTTPNGAYSFASPANVAHFESHEAFEFVTELTLASYHTDGNRKAFDALNADYLAYNTVRERILNQVAGMNVGNTGVTTTAPSFFDGLDVQEPELVGAGVGSKAFDSAPNFGTQI